MQLQVLVVSLMELLVRIHQAKARIILILAASRESRTPILMLDATVVQGRNNERQEVTNITKDGSEVTMGLIEDASNSDVDQSIATGEAETAGLGDESVSQINGLNNGTKKASDFVPNAGLEEYANVGKTRAIISQKNGHDVRSTVNLYVSTLTAGKDIVIIYLDNNTSNWVTVKNPTINWNTKYVSFEVPGSCTVQVLAK